MQKLRLVPVVGTPGGACSIKERMFARLARLSTKSRHHHAFVRSINTL